MSATNLMHGQMLRSIRIALALVSLIAYATLTLHLHQGDVTSPWQPYAIERSPMAAAVSAIVYGAPIGSVYQNLLEELTADDRGKTLKEELRHAANKNDAPGPLLNHTSDGIGIGDLVFVTEAMRVFGVHTLSLVSGFMCLMGLATVMFLIRFQDGRVLVIPLTFFSLTMMLFTPLGTDPAAISQVPVGGYRYFSLLAVIPALHIVYEFADRSTENYPRVTRFIAFSIQLFLILSAFIVSAAATYMFIFMLCCFVILAFIWRRKIYRNVLMKKAAFSVIFGALIYCAFYAWTPSAYKETGRVGDLFWNRLFVGVGLNPAWPFGNLKEVYSGCQKYIPGGLRPGLLDQNGHCVWEVYVEAHGMPPAKIQEELYGAQYEHAMREAFVNLLLNYPRETLKTFLYYKPLMVINTIRETFKFQFQFKLGGAMLIAQLIVLMGFSMLGVIEGEWRTTRITIGLLVLAAVCSCSLYVAAWGNIFTMSELLFYVYALIGAIIVVGIRGLPIILQVIFKIGPVRHSALPFEG